MNKLLRLTHKKTLNLELFVCILNEVQTTTNRTKDIDSPEMWLRPQFRVSCMCVYLFNFFRVCIDMYLKFFVYFRVFCCKLNIMEKSIKFNIKIIIQIKDKFSHFQLVLFVINY